ncbi:MAG: hypothetical protein JO270_15655 [Acidobacteriaceae bacterium]|nr:hypothetical protein [Acidobacteriaceae bacterium]MBV8570503.1 hypothetical protein [Acidobacteriaceae bacterium]
MSCKIERVLNSNNSVVLRVSGGIEGEHVGTLREVLRQEEQEVALDLAEVNLVDRQGVKLLAVSEANGIELRNCPGYVREWVSRMNRNANSGKEH